ncbi:MAG: BMP family ABC transporter substrate-binding protein, partial [Lachnospiraceae bacterium]|nr:BMP family ABC transporter substrate-binding protein [Lachnospiraceae bacterium]
MKKQLVSLVLAGVMVAGMLAGCTKKPGAEKTGSKSASTTTSEKKDGGYELALITDVGTIDDKSFNQGSWEGLKKYADENKIA